MIDHENQNYQNTQHRFNELHIRFRKMYYV